MHEDVIHAMVWLAQRTDEEVMRWREEAITRIEEEGAAMRASGECESWFWGVDPKVKAVAKGVNGPLMEALLRLSGHVDRNCAELFRRGGSW